MPGGVLISPNWHNGDASIFARMSGVRTQTRGVIVDPHDPEQQERLQRYALNILYYQQAQYQHDNEVALKTREFNRLRVNYSSIISKSVNKKATWLFGEPVGIHCKPLDTAGDEDPKPVEGDDPDSEDTSAIKAVKATINQTRRHNNSALWDYVMAIMGMVCGDFFVKVDAEADDSLANITLYDPSFCFPDYPDDFSKPMRACQIQYQVDKYNRPVENEQDADHIIIEDYRLELADSPIPFGNLTDPDDLPTLTEDQMFGLQAERPGDTTLRDQDPEMGRIVCMYRKYIDKDLQLGSVREIGIPAIPIVHGLNSFLWQSRYGDDEVGSLIPKLEEYNEQFFYAKRVARQNSHAKLALGGVRKEDKPLAGDYDDVIYLGEKGTAEVLSLPTSTDMLKMVTDALLSEMYHDANIPQIAEGETGLGVGAAPSGLALQILYQELIDINRLHQLTYGGALGNVNTLVLLFDEMVINGQAYGTKYKYSTWDWKFDWYDATPKVLQEIISDMQSATTDAGRGPLISHRTARENIPGIDPDLELERIKDETATLGQVSLSATQNAATPNTPQPLYPDGAGGFTDSNGNPVDNNGDPINDQPQPNVD